MNSGRGSGAGVQAVPAGSRKVVESLKEIVNCSEAEIYAALKECNMDPNEAVNRLLSQDPFHEVKRKREKKKEGKDNSRSRSRSANYSSNRGSKGGSDHLVARSSVPYDASESPLHGKSVHKKENGSTPYTSYLSSASGSDNNRGWGPSGLSGAASAESKGSFMGTVDGMPSAVQPTPEHQAAWMGVPGQVSMADIVRMGRTHIKGSNTSNAHHSIQNSSITESLQDKVSTEDLGLQIHQSETFSVQNAPTNVEWPSVENPAMTKVLSVPEYGVESEQHSGASEVLFDSVNLPSHEGVHEIEDDEIRSRGVQNSGSVAITSKGIQEDDPRGASGLGKDTYDESRASYNSEANDFEQEEDDEDDASVSSVTQNLQHLSVEKNENEFPTEGNAPSVVIPDHLQVRTADCSHLSFGSFRPAMSPAYSSGPVETVSTKDNLDLVHDEAAIVSVGHSDNRHSEYYGDSSLRNEPDSGLFHRTGASIGSYDTASASQPEELKPGSTEVIHGNQYSFPSNPGYAFDDKQNITTPFYQTGSQMQDLAPFSDVTRHNTNPLPGTLLAASPIRESDLHYSAFPVTQSFPSIYGSAVSSISASAISMSEALRNASVSSTQPALQNPSGANIATGPPLPQQLALHPYSQPALPLGPYAGIMGYPFLPQSYAYLQSAFPQSLAGSSTYHQSPASVLPQYKSSVSVSSLPQSAAVASGYGAFGSNATVPGNYSTLPSALPTGSTLNYDDVLSAQYKDSAHLLAQQNENLAAWLHGANSRTMPTQYNYPGQNHQLVGLGQGQQQSQNYGNPGYPNFYHSQSGLCLDQQQQNPRDGSLNNPQGQPKQSQLWPNGY